MAGTVEAFDEKERLRIANVLAAAMQVDASRFTVTLGAASVRLIILIDASDEQAATSLINSIGAELMPSAAAASSLLGVTVTSSPLLEVSTRELLLPLPPSPPPPPTPPPPESTASLLAVGVAILSAIVLLAPIELLWCCQRIRRKRRARMDYLALAARQQPRANEPNMQLNGAARPNRNEEREAQMALVQEARPPALVLETGEAEPPIEAQASIAADGKKGHVLRTPGNGRSKRNATAPIALNIVAHVD